MNLISTCMGDYQRKSASYKWRFGWDHPNLEVQPHYPYSSIQLKSEDEFHCRDLVCYCKEMYLFLVECFSNSSSHMPTLISPSGLALLVKLVTCWSWSLKLSSHEHSHYLDGWPSEGIHWLHMCSSSISCRCPVAVSQHFFTSKCC